MAANPVIKAIDQCKDCIDAKKVLYFKVVPVAEKQNR